MNYTWNKCFAIVPYIEQLSFTSLCDANRYRVGWKNGRRGKNAILVQSQATKIMDKSSEHMNFV